MKSSHKLLEKIIKLEYAAESILKDELADSELLKLDFKLFEMFTENLREMVRSRSTNNEIRNKNLSSKMSPNVLDEDQFDSFYQNINFDEYETEILKSKINSIIGFNFPVLELFPGQGHFTESAVSGEPLYIVDYYLKTLDKVGNRFNEFYRERRLIKHLIKDFDLSMLPQNQFGVVFSFNLFIVKDENFIADWAKEVFKILRPGGHFVFNFIPDDTVEGLKMCEEHPLTAINHNSLEQKILSYGYELISKDYKQRANTSTFVIKKPGEITEFKLTSSLARIIDKLEPFV